MRVAVPPGVASVMRMIEPGGMVVSGAAGVMVVPEVLPVTPELPEVAVGLEVLLEVALPKAVAGPVAPELPESPERALPPVAVALPRTAVLVAVVVMKAGAEIPVLPELPDVATGEETAVLEALPVSPVLVALDWP